MFPKFSKGFNIIELTVAITILTIGLVGIYPVFTRTISFFPYISSKFEAAYLTQEGIEIIRNIRDTNWIKGLNWKEGLTHCSGGCEADYKTGTPQGDSSLRTYMGSYLNLDENNLYSYSSGGTSSNYKRKIVIEEGQGDDEFLVVRIIVEWDVKGKTYSIEAEDHLYNWY